MAVATVSTRFLFRLLPWWLPLLCGGETVFAAEEQPDADGADEAEEQSPVWQRAFEEMELDSAWNWLESRRDDVSRNVDTVGRSLDDWLAGEAVGERANESYLRLKLNQRMGRHDAYFSNVRIGGSLDLPRATERWKLIFDSEDNERNSLREQRLDNIVPSSFSGAFSYELEERNGWQFNHDFGIRGRLPLDPFYRFRTRFGTEFAEHWQVGLDQRSYFYHSDGWGNDLRVYFGRQITERLLLRMTTEAHYRHHLRETEFGQYLSLHQTLGERETMSYEVGMLGVNRPNTRIQDYYVQMVYRKAIYEDWLILEVVPQVLTERDMDWKTDPRLQVNLEVYFFES